VRLEFAVVIGHPGFALVTLVATCALERRGKETPGEITSKTEMDRPKFTPKITATQLHGGNDASSITHNSNTSLPVCSLLSGQLPEGHEHTGRTNTYTKEL
jgi:hypothetical protein